MANAVPQCHACGFIPARPGCGCEMCKKNGPAYSCHNCKTQSTADGAVAVGNQVRFRDGALFQVVDIDGPEGYEAIRLAPVQSTWVDDGTPKGVFTYSVDLVAKPLVMIGWIYRKGLSEGMWKSED